jgi:hypothetical protein
MQNGNRVEASEITVDLDRLWPMHAWAKNGHQEKIEGS